jgi:hypothetical protein
MGSFPIHAIYFYAHFGYFSCFHSFSTKSTRQVWQNNTSLTQKAGGLEVAVTGNPGHLACLVRLLFIMECPFLRVISKIIDVPCFSIKCFDASKQWAKNF